MKKKLSEKQEIEATFIKDWCLIVINFIYSKYSEQMTFGEMFKEAFSEETKLRYLKELSPSIYLKGLRMAFNDTNEMAMDAPYSIQEELNKMLRNKFGKDLNTYSKKILREISKIKTKEDISNIKEYRLVQNYIDDIRNDEAKVEELNILNSLILKWDNKLSFNNEN